MLRFLSGSSIEHRTTREISLVFVLMKFAVVAYLVCCYLYYMFVPFLGAFLFISIPLVLDDTALLDDPNLLYIQRLLNKHPEAACTVFFRPNHPTAFQIRS